MKKRVILLLAALTLVGCWGRNTAGKENVADEGKMTYYEMDGFALGTTYHIVYMAKDTVSKSAIDNILNDFVESCSIFDSTSLLSRINRNETDTVDTNIRDCIELALRLGEESNGMYDITVKPLIEAYGFAAEGKTAHPDIDSLLEFVGYEKISLDGNRLVKQDSRIQIDLNSVAKGYCSDLVGHYFEKRGIENYLVEIGGEIATRGTNNGKEWRVGIDKPIDHNNSPGASLQTILLLKDKGLATSGNYRRFYIDEEGNRVNHTVNPKTGLSVKQNLLSATVLAPTCAEADAYATLFMASGLDESIRILKENPDLAGYLIYSETPDKYGVYISDNLQNKIME